VIGYHVDARMRRVLQGAETEALRVRTPYVAPEHVLLALLADPTDVPAATLASLGAQPETLRAAVEAVVRPTPLGEPLPLPFPYTSRAKRTLELTREEAVRSRAPSLSPELLLLALLQDDRTLAYEVLTQAGVTLANAREALQRFDAPGPT
jgi:ATP-dependent Clp protease ATP-binding subunit ClpC